MTFPPPHTHTHTLQALLHLLPPRLSSLHPFFIPSPELATSLLHPFPPEPLNAAKQLFHGREWRLIKSAQMLGRKFPSSVQSFTKDNASKTPLPSVDQVLPLRTTGGKAGFPYTPVGSNKGSYDQFW